MAISNLTVSIEVHFLKVLQVILKISTLQLTSSVHSDKFGSPVTKKASKMSKRKASEVYNFFEFDREGNKGMCKQEGCKEVITVS